MTLSFAAAVLASSILSGTSLLYATLGELVGERAGIVNLGLEGNMLIGAAVESPPPRSPTTHISAWPRPLSPASRPTSCSDLS